MQNTIKTRSGRTLIVPTPEEDAEIQRGIDADPDTYELCAEEIANLKPIGIKRMGRAPKEQISVRYDADIWPHFARPARAGRRA
jgi:hypothetical protein